MVNKTAVGLLGVVIFASLGVGILIGMQLGAGGPADAATNASPSPDGATETPAGEEADATSTEETATPADDAGDQRTEIPPRQFDEGAIADHVAMFVNEERAAQNRSELVTGDNTATRVSHMARNHSVGMADHGDLAHEIDGDSTAARYKQNDLFERCKFKSPEGSYIRQPDEKFELIAMSYAGTHYEDDGEEQFNGDERAVARAIVDDWNESSTYGDRLLVKGPTRMGVGVEVTSEGKVFATVDVCA